jgi:hypothetical protein
VLLVAPKAVLFGLLPEPPQAPSTNMLDKEHIITLGFVPIKIFKQWVVINIL